MTHPPGNPPHDFLGSYKLEFDMTFTPLADVKTREEQMKTVGHIRITYI